MQLADNLLVEPGCEIRVKFTFQRSPEEALRVQNCVSIVFEVLEVLLGEDPADDLFLGRAFLLVGFPVLELSPVVFLFESGLVGLQFLGLSQPCMSLAFVLIFLFLFFP